MPRVIRFTWRPHITLFEQCSLSTFQEFVVGKATEQFMISEERGANSPTPSHFEGWVRTSERTDNFSGRLRKSIEKFYRSIDPSFIIDTVMLHLCTVKEKDETYTLGYCLKESFRSSTLKYVTNISEEQIVSALDLYNSASKFSKQVVKSSFNVDQLTEMLLQVHREHSCTTYYPAYLKELVRDNKVSYSVYCKIKHEVLREYIEIKLGCLD